MVIELGVVTESGWSQWVRERIQDMLVNKAAILTKCLQGTPQIP